MDARDAHQAVNAIGDFAEPQRNLTKKLLVLRKLVLKPSFVIALHRRHQVYGLRQHLQPLIKGHDLIVGGLAA